MRIFTHKNGQNMFKTYYLAALYVYTVEPRYKEVGYNKTLL